MTTCKTEEAREFYIRSYIENHYSKREHERQIDSMLYERTAIAEAKYGALTKKSKGLSALRDAYVLEFLELPASYKEKDLRKQIISHLKAFILEFRNIVFCRIVIIIKVGIILLFLFCEGDY